MGDRHVHLCGSRPGVSQGGRGGRTSRRGQDKFGGGRHGCSGAATDKERRLRRRRWGDGKRQRPRTKEAAAMGGVSCRCRTHVVVKPERRGVRRLQRALIPAEVVSPRADVLILQVKAQQQAGRAVAYTSPGTHRQHSSSYTNQLGWDVQFGFRMTHWSCRPWSCVPRGGGVGRAAALETSCWPAASGIVLSCVSSSSSSSSPSSPSSSSSSSSLSSSAALF